MAKDAMKAAQTRQAFYSDRGRSDGEFNVGDHVLATVSSSLRRKPEIVLATS